MDSVINGLKAIWDFLTGFWDHLVDLLLWVPRKLFVGLLDGIVYLVGLIPVPDFSADLGSALSSVSPYIIYYWDFFALNFGLSVIFAAVVARFLVRRLPFIG